MTNKHLSPKMTEHYMKINERLGHSHGTCTLGYYKTAKDKILRNLKKKI